MNDIYPLGLQKNANAFFNSFSLEGQKIIKKVIAVAAITFAAISATSFFVLAWPVAAAGAGVASLLLSTAFFGLKVVKNQSFTIQDLEDLATDKVKAQLQAQGINIQNTLEEAKKFKKRDDSRRQCAVDSLRNHINWKFNPEDKSIEIFPKNFPKPLDTNNTIEISLDTNKNQNSELSEVAAMEQSLQNAIVPQISNFLINIDDQTLDLIYQMPSQCSILDYIHGLIRTHLSLKYPSKPIIKYEVSIRDVYTKIKIINDTTITLELKAHPEINYPITILDNDSPIKWDRLVSNPEVKMTFIRNNPNESWQINPTESSCSYTLTSN